MKLTEAKLKQMIREAMDFTGYPPAPKLPHLDKITDLFAASFEQGLSAVSLIESLKEYGLEGNAKIKEDGKFDSGPMIEITFENPNQAQEFISALSPKMNRGGIYGLPRVRSLSYPHRTFELMYPNSEN